MTSSTTTWVTVMSLKKPVTVTVHDQAMAYNRLAPSFPPESLGQWVVIAGLQSLGFYDTMEEAERAADVQGFDRFNRYIRRVGSAAPFAVFMASS